MESRINKWEFWLRWGFAAALVIVMGLSFYGSPFYHLVPSVMGSRVVEQPRCRLELARDSEFTAGLGLPGLESLAATYRNIGRGFRLAQQACRKDTSLKTVYVRQNCGAGRTQISRTVFCR
jgi:hypothetical protein